MRKFKFPDWIAALLFYIFLHEILGMQGYIGAALIFAAVIFTRLLKKSAVKNVRLVP